MPDKPNDAEGQGGEGQGGDGGGEGSGGGNEKPWYEEISKDDVITPAKLQGIIKASEAKTAKEIQSAVTKATADLPSSVQTAVAEALKTANTNKGEGGGGDSNKDDETAQELASLKRQLDESNSQVKKLQDDLQGERTTANEVKKKSAIMTSLGKAKCSKPEAVYEIIRNRVKFDPEKGEAVVMQDNGYGAEEARPLDDYISKEIRIDELPELFQGANKPGSSATGDHSSGGGGSYKYDWNRAKKDPQLMASEEFLKALEDDKVANVPQQE